MLVEENPVNYNLRDDQWMVGVSGLHIHYIMNISFLQNSILTL